MRITIARTLCAISDFTKVTKLLYINPSMAISADKFRIVFLGGPPHRLEYKSMGKAFQQGFLFIYFLMEAFQAIRVAQRGEIVIAPPLSTQYGSSVCHLEPIERDGIEFRLLRAVNRGVSPITRISVDKMLAS